jgi:7,8-dihydropterin-6-yl-methyl-4-(beta-D-ribofuranosyl)aminobenzene 5'-phosphate synthase
MKNIVVKIFLGVLLVVAVAISILLVRQSQVNAQIEQEWQSQPVQVEDLGSTTRLEIIPLYENGGDAEKYILGHGVSYLIRTDQVVILLDVGNNPENLAEAPFLQNMRALGIDWEEIDRIFISHPHPDHIGGVQAWTQGKVMLGSQPVGLSAKLVNAPVNLKGADLVFAQDPQPFVIAQGVGSLGVLPFPELFPLSLIQPRGSEQSLVVNVEGRGLVLITGCGHPTLENMVARAEAAFGLPVVGVVGGLHYIDFSAEDAQAPIQFLADRQPQLVALSPHDSTPQAIAAFQAAFPDAYQPIRVGEAIQFPNP